MKKPAIIVALLVAVTLPASLTSADDGAPSRTRPDRLVLTLRADFAQVHSHHTNFFALGGSLGVHIPLGELPIGVGLHTSLVAGDGHLASTTDLTLRYYVPMSGDDPGDALQPYVRGGAAVSVINWDEQDTSAAVGGMLGIGIQTWVSDAFALDFEIAYRVLGGPELRQTLTGSVGLAFGT